MKQVNIESINERIAQLKDSEHIGGVLSTKQQFELACLQQLLAVTEQVRLLTEQRDSVVVECLSLKSAIIDIEDK